MPDPGAISFTPQARRVACNAKRLCGMQVDHQLKPRGP
jgi:hypothetical protein